ncbi:MAG: polysaccharide deacetylase family protein [Rhodospirillales bacterium]|nr:polysaccharide deacetylase family protein [Rhodospirillales bacterium]
MIRHLVAPLWLATRHLLPPTPPSGAFRVLLLHDIATHQEAALDRLLAHIGRAAGFLTPGDVPARLAATISDGTCPVLVSFDDGFASNHALAKSVLACHGVKALFFVCPGLMDLPRNKQSAAVAANVFRGKTDAVPDLMTWDQVAELVALNHTIGGHGMSHACLAGLDSDRLEDEIGDARRRLTERLGRAADWFAFPFGDIASIDKAALGIIGRHFRYCRSGVRGLNRAGTSPIALLAEYVDLNAPFAYQRLALEGGLDFRYAEARTRLEEMIRA